MSNDDLVLSMQIDRSVLGLDVAYQQLTDISEEVQKMKLKTFAILPVVLTITLYISSAWTQGVLPTKDEVSRSS